MDDSEIEDRIQKSSPPTPSDDPTVRKALDRLVTRQFLQKPAKRWRPPAVLALIFGLVLAGGAAVAGPQIVQWMEVDSDLTITNFYTGDDKATGCIHDFKVLPDTDNPSHPFNESEFRAAREYLITTDWAGIQPDLTVLDPEDLADAREHGVPEVMLLSQSVEEQIVEALEAEGLYSSIQIETWLHCPASEEGQ